MTASRRQGRSDYDVTRRDASTDWRDAASVRAYMQRERVCIGRTERAFFLFKRIRHSAAFGVVYAIAHLTANERVFLL